MMIDEIRVMMAKRDSLAERIRKTEEILHKIEICQLEKDSLDKQLALGEELASIYREMIAMEGKITGYEDAFRLMGKENPKPESEKEEKSLKTGRDIYERVLKPQRGLTHEKACFKV